MNYLKKNYKTSLFPRTKNIRIPRIKVKYIVKSIYTEALRLKNIEEVNGQMTCIHGFEELMFSNYSYFSDH